MILPIFHASSISQWKDETNQIFANTPEKYTAPTDMMSWEKTGNKITLKENVVSYTGINAKEITTINGKLFVQEAPTGNNFILVRAYDASSTDPFDESASPLTEKYIPFQIASLETSGIGSEWMIMVALGLIVRALVLIEIKYD
jgi:hypothetical protein